MPPDGEIISGRKGIQEYWAAAGDMGMSDPHLTSIRIEDAGDIFSDIGTADVNINGSPVKLKYIAVWKRQPNGQWLMSADIWNMTP